MKLKAFDTLDRLYKLYEAADEETDAENTEESADDNDAAETDDTDDTADDNPSEESAEAQPEDQNPEIQADPTDGKFVSPEEKAKFAKIALNALLFSVTANRDSIPQDLQNINVTEITADNADKIINSIASVVQK